LEHAPRDPDDTAVLADLDPKLHGLPLRIRADVPLFTVSCTAPPRMLGRAVAEACSIQAASALAEAEIGGPDETIRRQGKNTVADEVIE